MLFLVLAALLGVEGRFGATRVSFSLRLQRQDGAAPLFLCLVYGPDSSRGLVCRATFWDQGQVHLTELRRTSPGSGLVLLGDFNMHWPHLDAGRRASQDLPVALTVLEEFELVCHNRPGVATRRSGTIIDWVCSCLLYTSDAADDLTGPTCSCPRATITKNIGV